MQKRVAYGYVKTNTKTAITCLARMTLRFNISVFIRRQIGSSVSGFGLSGVVLLLQMIVLVIQLSQLELLGNGLRRR